MMASFSSKKRMSFQVYVSFQGRDVRRAFLSHLHAALDQAGVSVYKDDEQLAMREQLQTTTMEALKESHVAIIIFSKDYASSLWCLRELERLMELRAQEALTVLPVFYDVTAAEVRWPTASYARAIGEHEEREVDPETMRRWREALYKAGNLAGWQLCEEKSEATLVKKIVERISELKRFDVFLSFWGRDDHGNFINNLNKELVEKGINTFMDSESSMMGQDFPPALKDAIKDAIKQSRMYVVVFSKKYAESWWCLKELVQILERSRGKPLIFPIFYSVPPGEVRSQKNTYEKELDDHEIEFGKRKVKKWREALTKVANMQGRHLDDGSGDDWIPRIVEDIENMMVEIKRKP
ncbi:hypothetical protein EUGRSUZ_H01796 [Eucalyptus grandis]|uniref:Uncharacterized protein n=2 Tax=Eucalyptus grandis TaxID=71139 RepID=A0ACC3JQ05_EUCGR|nr:hypothetical protein EUGRSUZ_H01796 [Eucalyptus grandis]